MKTFRTKISIMLLFAAFIFSFNMQAATDTSGFFGSMAEMKVMAEGYMRLAMQDKDISKEKRGEIERNFLDVQAAADKLLVQMQNDLGLYTGFFGYRIIRQVKAFDKKCSGIRTRKLK